MEVNYANLAEAVEKTEIGGLEEAIIETPSAKISDDEGNTAKSSYGGTGRLTSAAPRLKKLYAEAKREIGKMPHLREGSYALLAGVLYAVGLTEVAPFMLPIVGYEIAAGLMDLLSGKSGERIGEGLMV